MIFRALFWIGVVAVLMPREPDLGLGRPGTHDFARKDASLTCEGYGKACATTLGLLDDFQTLALRSLARVKADIDADERTQSPD